MKIGHKTLSASGKLLSTTVLGSGALLLLFSLPVEARADDLPTGGTVVVGAAAIGGNGQTTTINQSSSRAVINWDSFSVSQGKTVSFIQPDVHSATLNRVTGNSTSTIAGQISSNGAIYLVNPNGIAITATGAVQTGGGFVASTLAMADGDFMAGKAKFTGSGSSASVSNAGHISAGLGAYVALLGGSVANSGTIAVPLGRVGLGSGENITLDLNGDGFMQVAVPTSALTGDAALISHSGTISASGGLVMLKAATVKDAVRNVINLSGGINADSATGSAGNIQLLGGDGGTVTVSGTLSAQATGATGNGGLIETSGANVNFTGLKVNTSSVGGLTGTWLVDPTDLTIDAAAATTISANLATSNVVLQTNADGTTSGPGDASVGNGDINVNAAIGWNSANTLTLSAYHDVNIRQTITGGINATVNVRSDNSGSGSGSIYFSNPGAIGFQSGSGTGSHINMYYNPVSYAAPNDYSPYLAGTSDATSLAYMLVNNVGDLQKINDNLAGSYALGRDIDASATETWNGGAGFVPLGTDGLGVVLNSGLGFTGHFSGNHYTISGLTIARPASDYVGLFGAVKSSDGGYLNPIYDFQDLTITDAKITGHNFVGGVFGYIGNRTGVPGNEATNINNISFSGSVQSIFDGGPNPQTYTGGIVGEIDAGGSVIYLLRSSGTVNGSAYVGGIAGSIRYSSILNSYSTSDVTGNSFVGGFAGYSASGSSSIFATGDVTGLSHVGGLYGYSVGYISIAYSSGNVSVIPGMSGQYIGGLIGEAAGGGYSSNVYSTSNIDAPNSIYVGGLIGMDYGLSLRFGYYAGRINASGSLYAGTLAGVLGEHGGQTTIFLGIFWDGDLTGPDAPSYAFGGSGGTFMTYVLPGSTSSLQDYNRYLDNYHDLGGGWDFTNIWSPPAQAGQAGQTSGYYPQFYALSPVVVASAADATRAYGASNPAFSIAITAGGPYNAGGGGYVLGPGGATAGADTLSAQALMSGILTPGASVGQYSILGNSATSNGGVTYRVIDATGGKLTITPASLTVLYTADPFSRLYGAANPAFTGAESATGLVNGDTLAGVTTGTANYSTTATSGSNVGSYAVNGSGLAANSGNYAFTFAQAAGNAAALTINPAALTITYTADPFSRLYGAASPAFTGTQGVAGLVNGDTLTGVTTGTASYATTATAGSNIGSYAISGSGLSANSSNYDFIFTQAAGNTTALTINPASLSVVADPLSRLYGAANPTLTYVTTGLVNGDTLSGMLATSATTASSVGTYGITQGTLTASNNYTLSFSGALLTINPARLTVTYAADPFSRLYGVANPAFTGTQSATGLVNGDTLAGVTAGNASYASAATSGSNVGSYAISGSGLSANSSNYDFIFAQAAGNAAALTINPAALTITYTADPFSRFYGAANPAFTGTQGATGLVNGDTLADVTSGTASYATSATASSNIGSYAVNGSGLAANSGNYNFTFTQAAGNASALTINPAALMVVANPLSRAYGAVNPALTYVTTGLVNGDTLSGMLATSATTASSVGTYGITQGTLAASSNYALSFTGAMLTIDPAALTVTYTADPLSRLYGAANPALTGTQSATGLVNGDTLAGVTTGTASYATSAATGSNVGSYAINGSGLAANSANYNFTLAQAVGNATALTINPASLTVTYTADPFSRFYGAANPAFTGTQSATGLVNGDTLAAVTTGTASYTTSATTGSNIGSYAISGSGLAANSGNYNFTFVQAAGNATALTISPAALSVVADPLSRTYGAANPALTYAATGLVNGDTLSGNLVTSATTASSVGTYGITRGTLAASSNYALSFTGALLTINPAALTITYTADPFSRLYGVANPAFTGTQSATGLVNGDTFADVTTGTASYATTATTGSNVGSYAINGSGLSANSANYSFTFAQAAGNATALKITPRSLSVTADPISRQFGAPNPPLTYVIAPTTATSGLLNGDSLTGALSTTATQMSPSGDYAILQGSLMASSNYIFNYTGANLTIELPPLQSLSSFVPIPTTGHEADQAGAKGCTSDQMSEQLREKGEAKVGTGTGNTSCD